MAKFVFQLQAVLRQRESVEQIRQRELATIQARMTALEAELRGIDESVKAMVEDLRTNRLIGKIDLSFLAAHRRFTLSMQRKALEIAQQMAGVKRLQEEARQRLAEAAKQRKVMEKLRERQEIRWKEDQARRELAEMDEISMRLAYGNMMEGGNP
jgi:flagellar FliJ protein